MLLSKEEIEERVMGYLISFPKEASKVDNLSKLISSLHHAQTQVHGLSVDKILLRTWSARIGLTLSPAFNNAIVKKDIESKSVKSASSGKSKDKTSTSIFAVFNAIFVPPKSILSKPYSQRMMHVHSG